MRVKVEIRTSNPKFERAAADSLQAGAKAFEGMQFMKPIIYVINPNSTQAVTAGIDTAMQALRMVGGQSSNA